MIGKDQSPDIGKDTQFKPGESGNPEGKKPGTKSLATIIEELESEDFDWSKVPIRDKKTAQEMGAPWRAIVYVALAKAYSGDVKAMEWLRKSGYGDKLDVTTGGRRITQQPLIVSDIKAYHAGTESQTESGDSAGERSDD